MKRTASTRPAHRPGSPRSDPWSPSQEPYSPRYEPRSPSYEPCSPLHRPKDDLIEEVYLSQESSGEEEMGVSGKDGEDPAACPTEETGMDAQETATLNACSCLRENWCTCGASRRAGQ